MSTMEHGTDTISVRPYPVVECKHIISYVMSALLVHDAKRKQYFIEQVLQKLVPKDEYEKLKRNDLTAWEPGVKPEE